MLKADERIVIFIRLSNTREEYKRDVVIVVVTLEYLCLGKFLVERNHIFPNLGALIKHL